VLHLAVLLVLALWTRTVRAPLRSVTIDTRLTRAREMPEFNQLAPEVVQATGVVSFYGSAAAVQGERSEPVTTPQQKVDHTLLPDARATLRAGTLDMPGRTSLDLAVRVKGEPMAEASDIAQAMDRLTREILLMLHERPVLAVWLFDESNSMKDEQAEIRDRLERVYDELGLSGQVRGDALLTSVVSFGDQVHFHTDRPTADREQIRRAIDSVPIDPSGKENTCAAILEVVAKYNRFWTQGRRRVAIILLTDESGDDGGRVEEALAAVQKGHMPVYVLGRQSIFGYPFARLVWRHEATGRVFYPPIRRGPESADVECLQYNGFYERWDEQSSGFGPYELVRLCRDSGGIYFIMPSEELYVKEQRYDLASLREYVPEYLARREYAMQRSASPLRSGLAAVIQATRDFRVVAPHHDLNFPMRRDRFDPAARKSLDTVRRYRAALENAYQALERLAPERDREPSRRWRAHYDLIHAQVLAYAVKMIEYESILTHLLNEHPTPKGPADPKRPRTNHWSIRPSSKQFSDPKVIAAATARATSLLQEVSARHANTPWDQFARWELSRGFGLALHEYYVDPNPPPTPPRPSVKIDVPNF
jgi:hypothetical protein